MYVNFYDLLKKYTKIYSLGVQDKAIKLIIKIINYIIKLMITLTGINKSEFINPHISRLHEVIARKHDDANTVQALQAIAHGLLRKTTSTYTDETSLEVQEFIVEKAYEALKNFQTSEEEIEITYSHLPGAGNTIGFFTVLYDRPFIVDTIREYFSANGIFLSALFHPIFKLQNGNDLSICYTEMDAPGTQKITSIIEELTGRLRQLKATTNDFNSIIKFLSQQKDFISTSDPAQTEEIKDLLRWFSDGALIFLGIARWDIPSRSISEEYGILREKKSSFTSEIAPYLLKDLDSLLLSKESFLCSKVPLQSPVHRPNYIDLITIRVNQDSALSIPALFTSKTINQPVSTIPLLRHKLSEVLIEEGLIPNSHDYKELISIADTLPKSDFFQYSNEEIKTYFKEVSKTLLRGKATLIHMIDHSKRFHYFTTILPRERYSTVTVLEVEELLRDSFTNKPSQHALESFSMLGDYPIVLIRTILPLNEKATLHTSVEEVEDRIEDLTCSWDEKLRNLLGEQYDESKAVKLFTYYSKALDDTYKTTHSPEESICDIQMLERLSSEYPLELSLEEHPSFEPQEIYRLRLYKRGERLTLSGIVPFLENTGFEIISETVTSVATEGAVWAAIYDLFISPRLVSTLDSENVSGTLLPALKKILQKEADNDYLNHLLITPGIPLRDISILRGIVRYLVQIRLAPSPWGAMDSLVKNPEIASLFVLYFYTKFNPDTTSAGKASPIRIESLKHIDDQIRAALKNVPQLSHDRSLRAMWNVLHATVRTNFFTLPEKNRIAFKIDCSKVHSLPEPRPFMEIFVSAPGFQGVHLRGGKVSRGGLRWSSRKDDFRTEVLGLMKTQMVKNSIIVPVGAKGGFVLREEPEERTELFEAVKSTYKEFIRSLLDITDNRIDDAIVTPENIVYYDEEDPYLVVAADRGTATFSDLANTIATEEYAFWLGDAFASGGSAGYDHKVLGITAKGAWECALRHFKEVGIDPEAQEFTVVGVGDMSGDVFGNGLLRSNKAKLIAAFDHRHIFIDPDPDPKRSFEERSRLFKLDRSSWDDYDRSLLSHGACIVSRKEKEIQISPEAQQALGTDQEIFSSHELIKTILKAPVDLLWNGGIGTYVKASTESNLEASDKDNDEVRVNGKELRAKIVAEGGNLGFTQLGRIEYTKIGGHINTDAVDNSGGVDMSDLEVNLKLLFQKGLLKNEITIEERNSILKECENEACEKVLSRNRSQSVVLSMAVRRSRKNLKFYQELISSFEQQGRLTAAAEHLPDEETFEKRRLAKAGLSRPELAILVAHTKMSVFETILESDLTGDPFMQDYLYAYFPQSVIERFKPWISEHTLKDEIIATQVANVLVERMSSTFVYRLSAELGASPIEIIRSYIISDAVFSGTKLVRSLSVLDKANTTRFYLAALLRTQRALESIARWFLGEEIRNGVMLSEIIDKYREDFNVLLLKTEEILSSSELTHYQESVRELLMHAVPKDLAQSISAVRYAPIYLDIIRVSKSVNFELVEIAKLYGHLATELQIGQLVEATNSLTSDSKWDNLASKTLGTQFRKSVANLCECIIKESNNTDLGSVAVYFLKRKDLLEQYKESLAQITKEDPSISSLYILSNLLMMLSE